MYERNKRAFPLPLISSPSVTSPNIMNHAKLITSDGIMNPPLAKTVNGVERANPSSTIVFDFNPSLLIFVLWLLLVTSAYKAFRQTKLIVNHQNLPARFISIVVGWPHTITQKIVLF